MTEETAPKPEKKKVDEAWKAKMKAETAKLDAKPPEPEKAPDPAPEPEPEPPKGVGIMPGASMQTLITTFASNALICLGEVVNPVEKKKLVDLDAAKFAIDMLQVIEDKTKGNLNEIEQRYIETVLYDLRLRYVTATRAAGKA